MAKKLTVADAEAKIKEMGFSWRWIPIMGYFVINLSGSDFMQIIPTKDGKISIHDIRFLRSFKRG